MEMLAIQAFDKGAYVEDTQGDRFWVSFTCLNGNVRCFKEDHDENRFLQVAFIKKSELTRVE